MVPKYESLQRTEKFGSNKIYFFFLNLPVLKRGECPCVPYQSLSAEGILGVFYFRFWVPVQAKAFSICSELLCWLESVCFGEEVGSLLQAPHSRGCTSVTLWSWTIICHLFTLPPSLLGKYLLPSPKASSFAQLFKSFAFFISTQVWMIKQQLGL